MFRRAFGILIALTMTTVACGSSGSTTPATSPTSTSVVSVGSAPTEPILGTWRMEYTCEKFVRAFEDAGIGELATRWLVNWHFQKGPVSRLAGSADPCDGARQGFQRTHFFRPNGYLINYQEEKIVDDCHCYLLVDSHTFVSLGDPGDPDVSLRYAIDGDELTFEVVIPDRCSTAQCRNAIAFTVGQYTLGPWQRVN
jgi:hypothetical protein